MGVPEVDATATGRGSGGSQPGDDLVAVGEKLLDLDPEVGAERSQIGEGLPRLPRTEWLAFDRPIAQVERCGGVVGAALGVGP